MPIFSHLTTSGFQSLQRFIFQHFCFLETIRVLWRVEKKDDLSVGAAAMGMVHEAVSLLLRERSLHCNACHFKLRAYWCNYYIAHMLFKNFINQLGIFFPHF